MSCVQVHRAADPQRSSAASAVLKNIHYHPDNATTLYKAELKLKHAALMQLKGGWPLTARMCDIRH